VTLDAKYRPKSTTTEAGLPLTINLSVKCPDGINDAPLSLSKSGPTNDQTVWCEQITIDSCPIGNPIDLYSGDKYEFAVDYISPNKLLRIERRYTNQNDGWSKSTLIPRMLYVGAGDSVKLSDEIPGSSSHHSIMNIEEVPVIYVWEHGQQSRFLFDIYSENVIFKPEFGGKGNALIELLTNSTIPTAFWKMTNTDGSLSYFNQTGVILKTIHSTGDYVEYDVVDGKLMRQTDRSGRSLSYVYNGSGHVSLVVLPNGNSITYSYVDGLLTKVTWPDGENLSYVYNESAQIIGASKNSFLTGKLDSYGNRVGTYKYIVGKATSTEGFGGANKRKITKRRSNYVRVKNSLGAEHTWYFNTLLEDGQRLLTGTMQPSGAGSNRALNANAYNADGQLTQKRDYNNNKTQYAYHPVLKVNTVRVDGVPLTEWASFTAEDVTLPAGVTKTSTLWDETLRKPIRIAAANILTSIVYHGAIDSFNNNELANCTTATLGDDPMPVICRIVEQATTDINGQLGFNAVIDTQAQARHTLLAYDNKGQLLTVKRSPNYINDVTYDYYQETSTTHNLGDLKSVTNALGHQVQYQAYNASGMPTEILDANGVQTALTYDSRERLITTSTAGQITSLTYDLNGNLLTITEPNGITTTREYDGAGKLTAITDELLNRFELDYDLEGNVLSSKIVNSTAELLFSKHNQYDALNRLQKTIQSSGAETDYLYDGVGNITSKSDGKKNITRQVSDANNRVNKVTDALSGIVNTTYDSLGRILTVKDQANLVTSYEYNAFGDIIQLTSPDTGITTFTYDNKGNVLTKTDARNVIATFTYDALNRLKTQSYPDISENIVYTYDDITNGNKGIGKLTSVTDNSGSTSYFYNALGQVSKETRVIDGKTFVTQYHFNAAGQLTGLTYPSGRGLTYTFDTLGRVSGVNSTYQTQSTVIASDLSYLAFGPMNSMTYGNGKVLTQSYDKDYRLIEKSVSDVAQKNYTYDLTNNIESISNLLNPINNQNFAYDKLSRLLTSDGEYGNLVYSYDKVGNRLSKSENGNTDTYSYEAVSHQLAQVTGTNAKSITYDEIGNTLTKADITFSYNQQGRLSTAAKTGMSANYLYNYKGERNIKSVNAFKTHFIYDLNGQLIAEADSNGVTQKEYIYLNGQRIASVIANEIYYVHTDHLATPVAITDELGNVQWKAHYTPFGKMIVDVNNLDNNIRFPGQYYDQESGLHYNYFRDYDPELGRYIQSDPIGLAGGINTYAYVEGNPLSYTDFYGLCPCGLPQNVISIARNDTRDCEVVKYYWPRVCKFSNIFAQTH